MSREPVEPEAPLPPDRFREILRGKAPEFEIDPGRLDFAGFPFSSRSSTAGGARPTWPAR